MEARLQRTAHSLHQNYLHTWIILILGLVFEKLMSQKFPVLLKEYFVLKNLSLNFFENQNNSEFYSSTYNSYNILTCNYHGIDCRRHWTLVGTVQGKCISLDVNKFTNITNLGSLALNFFINHTDAGVDRRAENVQKQHAIGTYL